MNTNPIPDGTLNDAIALWTHTCVASWDATADVFPDDAECFSDEEQRAKQEEIEHAVGRISDASRKAETMSHAERAALRDRMRAVLLHSLVRNGDPATDQFLKACEGTANEFVRTAREFDGSLSIEEVHQALRNEWVFNSLQNILGYPITMTSSSFAYSMLYPFTDNLLDRGEFNGSQKNAFLQWLTCRLEGSDTEEQTRFAAIGRLLALIEKEYDRTTFPMVYQSLLAIHRAQQRGLLLRNDGKDLQESEKLAITCTKGGCSVLVDGCLITGSLGKEQGHGVFLYGVVLQLIDDLQDVEEDRRSGHSTTFTRVAEGDYLDTTVNKLFWFVRQALTDAFPGAGDGSSPVASLITKSCKFLMLEAIARQQHLFSDDYVRAVQRRMPLPIDYLAGAKEKLTAMVSRTHAAAEEEAG